MRERPDICLQLNQLIDRTQNGALVKKIFICLSVLLSCTQIMAAELTQDKALQIKCVTDLLNKTLPQPFSSFQIQKVSLSRWTYAGLPQFSGVKWYAFSLNSPNGNFEGYIWVMNMNPVVSEEGKVERYKCDMAINL